MNLRPAAAADRIRQILEDLEAVRENVLALSDDIWMSIDHNDAEALEEGVRFKREYNERVSAFGAQASGLSALIQQFTSVRLEDAEKAGTGDRERNERIIAELNREQPHSVDEDFTFKRPHGFVLDGQGTTGITTWSRLYELFCRQLARRDPARFRALPENPNFLSNRGHRSFSQRVEELTRACLISDGIYAEINLSANGLRDMMRRLLAEFGLPADRLQLYLRQDRDAGSQGDAA